MDLIGALSGAAGAAGGGVNPNAWDISKAYYDAGAGAGDVSKSFYTSASLYVNAQDAIPRGLTFSVDGTSAYIAGDSTNRIFQYTLTTPWSISTASYASKSFLLSSQTTEPNGVFFKSDGTKMYVIETEFFSIFQYSLSTAWDVSTASYDSVSLSVFGTENAPRGLFFKPDGTKMYVTGTISDSVHEYDLSSAWDLSTASFNQSFSVAAQETAPQGIAFLGDGTKMYVAGDTGNDISQYDLSTAWDVSTASYVQAFSISSQETAISDLFIKPDGSLFFIIGTVADTIFQYIIGGFSVAAQETVPQGVFFKTDGTKMYVIGGAGDAVYEYDLSTVWDITTSSYLQSFSVSAQENNPSDVFFKADGTKMYVSGLTGDDVNEYDLSTPWDISSASYLQRFSVSSQDTNPEGLFFKPDGTKMYVLGNDGNDVNEYDLSTAWDISSASYLQNFSVNTQETDPTGISFKSDGTEMYVIGRANDKLHQYTLSTPWDVSSATFLQSFGLFLGEPRGIFFRNNGEQFFIADSDADKVFSYKISPT